MSLATSLRADFLCFPAWRMSKRCYFRGKFPSPHVWRSIRASSDWKMECSVERMDVPPDYQRFGISYRPSDLQFDRLQPSEDEISCNHRRVFGRFIAREAILDEEIWTAAWLRAESHWEDKPGDRHLHSHKRKFAEEEFHAIKRRCKKKYADDCTCFITVKKEDKGARRTVLSSIVGTVDFSIKQLLCGQTFPGERSKVPASCGIFRSDLPRYGYISNMCVAKYARRQGIASNMLLLAVDTARLSGLNQVFINVHQDNIIAQKLYDRIGFQIFEKATLQSEKENLHLLCYDL